MSIEIVDVNNINFDFYSGLRGWHFYRKFWKLFIGQIIIFSREGKNCYSRFAISGSKKIPGKIGHVVDGHIPQELSRYFWYAFYSGVIISGKDII